MKTIAALVVVTAAGILAGCGGSPALQCQTQSCASGASRTYQLCVGQDQIETWKFGGMSCDASGTEQAAVMTCATQIAAYCDEGAGGTGGTGGAGGTGGTGTSKPCTYTVSGAQTASGSCQVDAAVTPTSGGVAFTIVGGQTLDFAATLTGLTTLSDGTYDQTAAAPGYGGEYLVGIAGAYVLCSTSDNCNDAQGNPVPPQGSFQLTITDPGPSAGAAGASLWQAPQGTLTITMPALANGTESGTVTVIVTL